MQSSIRSVFRRLSAPEATWRRPDRAFRDVTERLSFLFAVDLYDLSTEDRIDVACFYASLPETAAFIVYRTADEALLQLQQAGRPESDTPALTKKVLSRLFTSDGAVQILRACETLAEARPNEVAELCKTTRILAVASVNIADATRQLTDFDSLVKTGAELAARDPNIAQQPEVIQAWIAKHWQFCGANIESAFESWYTADRLALARHRILKKVLSSGEMNGRDDG